MGTYIYRVTAKTIELDDGRIAHVAKFAYKPYHSWNMEKVNSRMHFRTGCVASENMTLKSDLIATLAEDGSEGEVYENKGNYKVFSDDFTFGHPDRMPRIGDVLQTGKTYKFIGRQPVLEIVS